MLAEMIKQQTDSIAASFAASSHAQVQTTEQSGDRIANAITDSLSDPLQKIAAAVNTTTDTNGQVVTKALNEVLVTFSAKLEDSFGGQMGAINQLLQQTTSAMQSTVARFDQLANNLDDAGKNAADAMSERLSVALESMESRQLALNKTMTDFVTQLRDMMQSSQSETSAHIQSTLALLGEQVAAMTEQLQSQASSAAESHQEQQNKLLQSASAIQQNISEQSSHLIEQLTEQVQAMLGQTTNVVSSMQTAVATMRDVTKDNTQRMEASAGTLALSAENFAKAGDSVAGVMQQTGSVSDKIATTSVALNTAAVTVQNALADYNNAGKTLSEMVAALKSTVEIAKLDASVSQGLVNQIKQSADNLQQAQSSVDGIFKEICEELANAHEVFTGNLTKAIKSSNTDYQKQLKDAVDILKTAIAELGDVVETIPARR
jgi:phenylalanyl-tRNA synthetase alpha subunit